MRGKFVSVIVHNEISEKFQIPNDTPHSLKRRERKSKPSHKTVDEMIKIRAETNEMEIKNNNKKTQSNKQTSKTSFSPRWCRQWRRKLHAPRPPSLRQRCWKTSMATEQRWRPPSCSSGQYKYPQKSAPWQNKLDHCGIIRWQRTIPHCVHWGCQGLTSTTSNRPWRNSVTLMWPGREEKAYVQWAPDYDTLDVANKIRII